MRSLWLSYTILCDVTCMTWWTRAPFWTLLTVWKCLCRSVRWSMAGSASCGTQQCWSMWPTMMKIAPSTPSAAVRPIVDMVSPCSTAAPTGTYSPRGKSHNSKQLLFISVILSSVLGRGISPALEKSYRKINSYIFSYFCRGHVVFYYCSKFIPAK